MYKKTEPLNRDLMPFEWKITTRGKTIRPVRLKLPNTP